MADPNTSIPSGVAQLQQAPEIDTTTSRLSAPQPDRLLTTERYLLSRTRAAKKLGLPDMTRWYSVGYLALKLWRIETDLDLNPHDKHVTSRSRYV